MILIGSENGYVLFCVLLNIKTVIVEVQIRRNPEEESFELTFYK